MGYERRIGEVIRYMQLIGYGIREAPVLFYQSPTSKLEIQDIELYACVITPIASNHQETNLISRRVTCRDRITD
jgi:hypothetical protein